MVAATTQSRLASSPFHRARKPKLVAGAWRQVSDIAWERSDSALVKFDQATAGSTTRPWLPQRRGWMAFVPGASFSRYLGYHSGRRRVRRPSLGWVPRKFKTAQSAMRALDREHPAGVPIIGDFSSDVVTLAS